MAGFFPLRQTVDALETRLVFSAPQRILTVAKSFVDAFVHGLGMRHPARRADPPCGFRVGLTLAKTV